MRRVEQNEPLDAVAQLQNRSFSRPWTAAALRWELSQTRTARLYVLEESSPQSNKHRLLAYCACWLILDELHINSLAVLPEVRRQGHARRLLLDVFRDVITQGATSATLEVRRSNTSALMLYERLGFRNEAVRPDYYQQPREDALILWHRELAGLRAEW